MTAAAVVIGVLVVVALVLAYLAGLGRGAALTLYSLRPERQLAETMAKIEKTHRDGVTALHAEVVRSRVSPVTPERLPDRPPRFSGPPVRPVRPLPSRRVS
ncbi:MAG: hypothetical protein AB7H53_19215 [Hyphomicrobium sp.]